MTSRPVMYSTRTTVTIDNHCLRYAKGYTWNSPLVATMAEARAHLHKIADVLLPGERVELVVHSD